MKLSLSIFLSIINILCGCICMNGFMISFCEWTLRMIIKMSQGEKVVKGEWSGWIFGFLYNGFLMVSIVMYMMNGLVYMKGWINNKGGDDSGGMGVQKAGELPIPGDEVKVNKSKRSVIKIGKYSVISMIAGGLSGFSFIGMAITFFKSQDVYMGVMMIMYGGGCIVVSMISIICLLKKIIECDIIMNFKNFMIITCGVIELNLLLWTILSFPLKKDMMNVMDNPLYVNSLTNLTNLTSRFNDVNEGIEAVSSYFFVSVVLTIVGMSLLFLGTFMKIIKGMIGICRDGKGGCCQTLIFYTGMICTIISTGLFAVLCITDIVYSSIGIGFAYWFIDMRSYVYCVGLLYVLIVWSVYVFGASNLIIMKKRPDLLLYCTSSNNVESTVVEQFTTNETGEDGKPNSLFDGVPDNKKNGPSEKYTYSITLVCVVLNLAGIFISCSGFLMNFFHFTVYSYVGNGTMSTNETNVTGIFFGEKEFKKGAISITYITDVVFLLSPIFYFINMILFLIEVKAVFLTEGYVKRNVRKITIVVVSILSFLFSAAPFAGTGIIFFWYKIIYNGVVISVHAVLCLIIPLLCVWFVLKKSEPLYDLKNFKKPFIIRTITEGFVNFSIIIEVILVLWVVMTYQFNFEVGKRTYDEYMLIENQRNILLRLVDLLNIPSIVLSIIGLLLLIISIITKIKGLYFSVSKNKFIQQLFICIGITSSFIAIFFIIVQFTFEIFESNYQQGFFWYKKISSNSQYYTYCGFIFIGIFLLNYGLFFSFGLFIGGNNLNQIHPSQSKLGPSFSTDSLFDQKDDDSSNDIDDDNK